MRLNAASYDAIIDCEPSVELGAPAINTLSPAKFTIDSETGEISLGIAAELGPPIGPFIEGSIEVSTETLDVAGEIKIGYHVGTPKSPGIPSLDIFSASFGPSITKNKAGFSVEIKAFSANFDLFCYKNNSNRENDKDGKFNRANDKDDGYFNDQLIKDIIDQNHDVTTDRETALA